MAGRIGWTDHLCAASFMMCGVCVIDDGRVRNESDEASRSESVL